MYSAAAGVSARTLSIRCLMSRFMDSYISHSVIALKEKAKPVPDLSWRPEVDGVAARLVYVEVEC